MVQIKYFAEADGWRPPSMIWALNYAISQAREIIQKSGRKQVTIYATDDYRVWYFGSVVPNGERFKFISRDGETSAINADGSLRAKPKPKSFI